MSPPAGAAGAEAQEIARRRAIVRAPEPRWPGGEATLLVAILVGRAQVRAQLPPDPPPPPAPAEVDQVVRLLGVPTRGPGPGPSAPTAEPARPNPPPPAPSTLAAPGAPPVANPPPSLPPSHGALAEGANTASRVGAPAASDGELGGGGRDGGGDGEGEGPFTGGPPFSPGAGGHTALAGIAPMRFVALASPEGAGPEVSRTEVTQAQWMALMGLDLEVMSGRFQQPAAPVGFCDALRYANLLSRRERLRPAYTVPEDCEDGARVVWDTRADGYRLPTEREWVGFAYGDPRGRRASRGNNLGLADVDDAASALGIVGTAGNAAEWVWAEAPGELARRRTAPADPVYRSCPESDRACRAVASRARRPLGVGLRLARNPPAR